MLQRFGAENALAAAAAAPSAVLSGGHWMSPGPQVGGRSAPAHPATTRGCCLPSLRPMEPDGVLGRAVVTRGRCLQATRGPVEAESSPHTANVPSAPPPEGPEGSWDTKWGPRFLSGPQSPPQPGRAPRLRRVGATGVAGPPRFRHAGRLPRGSVPVPGTRGWLSCVLGPLCHPPRRGKPCCPLNAPSPPTPPTPRHPFPETFPVQGCGGDMGAGNTGHPAF